jgi:metal-responsive CopG/Arc/MetJ family transcriptional regulator
MKRISLELIDNQYRELKIYCAKMGVTISEVIRKLIKNFLKEEGKKEIR